MCQNHKFATHVEEKRSRTIEDSDWDAAGTKLASMPIRRLGLGSAGSLPLKAGAISALALSAWLLGCSSTPGVDGDGTGAGGLPPSGAGGSGVGGAPGAGTGGAFAGVGGLAAGVGGAGPSVGGSGSGGGPALGSGGDGHTYDHCKYGYLPDPTDATMAQGPDVQSNPLDTWVQPEVIQWMEDREWQAAHFAWHRVRRCPGAGGAICTDGPTKGVTIPANQECKSDGDGYEFLAMHRHMIRSLKQLWPNHLEMFEGLDKFPQQAADVPEAWRSQWSSFSAAELANAKIADEIDKQENYSRFADEGKFGRWLQCGAPSVQFDLSGSGLHGSLHFKWTPPGNPPHSLGNQESNIDSYMFWKIHGWIDKVWEKYRIAIGKPVDDPVLEAAVEAQCREMDTLAVYINPDVPTEQGPDLEPDPGNETGFFDQQVRPILESQTYKCANCHTGGAVANGGLNLGGPYSSKSIVANLVNRPSNDGGQFKLVVPGNAAQSWLYLKMQKSTAGQTARNACAPTSTATCNTTPMPQGDEATVSAADLEIVRQWIEDHNAEGPP